MCGLTEFFSRKGSRSGRSTPKPASKLSIMSKMSALLTLQRSSTTSPPQKVTGNPNVDRPLQRIREFRNRPTPKVVVTVDMLSTGVDIPALEFIVFLRPVKSRILWEQMLGRGTRLCPDI